MEDEHRFSYDFFSNIYFVLEPKDAADFNRWEGTSWTTSLGAARV